MTGSIPVLHPGLATIGGRLKAERQRLGMSPVAFAALADAGRTAQYLWEGGKASPNAVALAAFERAGVDVFYVITGRRDGQPRENGRQCGDSPTLIDAYHDILCGFSAPEQVQIAVNLLASNLQPEANIFARARAAEEQD